jgi:hypothetical protein
VAMTTMSFANATHTEFGSYVRQCRRSGLLTTVLCSAHSAQTERRSIRVEVSLTLRTPCQ